MLNLRSSRSENNLKVKPSLSAMRTACETFVTVGNRRLGTTDVDSGVAARVLRSCQLEDRPLEPNGLSRVNGGYWTAGGQLGQDLQTRQFMGSISGVRNGFRESAAEVAKVALSVVDMVDECHVVLLSTKKLPRTIRVPKLHWSSCAVRSGHGSWISE